MKRKANATQKLELHKQTLRQLDAVELGHAAGGTSLSLCCPGSVFACPSATCVSNCPCPPPPGSGGGSGGVTVGGHNLL
jgi:hypothetical protein